MELTAVAIERLEDGNVIIGQAHFIKTVEDLHEALAARNAAAVGAGHSFVVVLRGGFPISVLNALKQVPEVCTVFCAGANPLEVIVAETGLGRAVLGVVDGRPPAGLETGEDAEERAVLLRRLGYKL